MPKIRRFVATAFLVLVSAVPADRAAAQQPDAFRVLGQEIDGVPTNQLLKKYELDQLRSHFAARRAAIKAITTPEQFIARQQAVRTKLMELVGPLPEKAPLNGKTVGKIQRDGYVIEKVVYESRPGHHITANLYLPSVRDSRIPGVLVPCGHSTNGKAAIPYQSICISLAKHGLAALIFDPIGQGERHQLLDDKGKFLVQGTTEHSLEGVGGWLVGFGCASYRIWDGIRSLDYLASRPEIDPERLGCTGNSGGGTMTSYLMAVDLRIKAAAPSCYLTTLERLFDTIGPQDAEQNFPGQVAFGIDHVDYITLRAPLPTIMCVGTQDYFDIDGAWTTFREAKAIYGLLGHGERMDLFEFNDKHGFSLPRRTAAMRFLRRWLVGKDDNPEEGELQLSSDPELQCTQSGEVLADFKGGVSVFDLNRKRADELAERRKMLWAGHRAKALDEVRRLSGMRPATGTPGAGLAQPASSFAMKSGAKGSVQKIILQNQGELPIPALLFQPVSDKPTKRPAVLYVSGDGKSVDAGADGSIAALVGTGKTVLSIDVRGIGETTHGSTKNRDGYFGTDFEPTLLALHLNRPMIGQRAEDVIVALNYLLSRDDVDSKQIEVIGTGTCGPVVLHAAAFDERIAKTTIVGSIESWSAVAASPLAKNQLTNVVPFALEYYDLPNLVAAIAPRTVEIRDPVDPTGKPLK